MQLRNIYLILFLAFTFGTSWSQKVFFSGNDDNSIFVCEDGRVFTSGENNTGQLGIGSLIPSNIPVEIAGIDGIGTPPRCKQAQIEGVSTFLALTNSGDTVIAWGINESGQAGDGTTNGKKFPVRVKGIGGVGYLQNIVQITSGNYTSYALTEEGKVVSWGNNFFNQLGTGSLANPVLFPDYVLKAAGDTLKNVKTISAGGAYCMALLCDGSVWAWGRNNLGQLGQSNTTPSPYAIKVKDSKGTAFLSNIIKIEAGDNFGLALSSTDTLWCWGADWNGQLGIGLIGSQLLPNYVRNSTNTGKLSGVIDMAGGQGHSVALMSDKTMMAWGKNTSGQLGKNDTINSNFPVRVKGPSGTGFLSDINYVGAGDLFCIARTSDNKLYIWGDNHIGQLGLNDHVNRLLPVLLILPCQPTSDIIPGYGKMSYVPQVCIGANSGNVYLNKHQNAILEWQQSFDNFFSYTSISNTNFCNPYSNLNKTTYYRAVLTECGINNYSPVAILSIDSITKSGIINASATVRVGLNMDTLRLVNYNGTVLQWEYSLDKFITDIHSINNTSAKIGYAGIQKTTYYRALVQSGVCPPSYSDVAEIKVVDESAVKIYNSYTPNGDDFNDEWVIDFIELFPDNKVEVYNRWGQLVYKTMNYDNVKNVWKGEGNVSGSLGSNVLADGTYFYLVNLREGYPVLKGYVVISR